MIILGVLFQMINLTNRIKMDITKKNAAILLKSLEDFRTLYTSEVVARVKSHGIEITHDYLDKESAIPLPATLSMKLGKLIGESDLEAKASLYSPYPFPWRKEERGELSIAQRQVWDALSKNPEKPYVSVEEIGGR